MSYPRAPGVSKPESHPSLPSRPPATTRPGFKPAFSGVGSAYSVLAVPPGLSAPGTAPSYGASPTTTNHGSYSGASAYGPMASAGDYGQTPNSYTHSQISTSYQGPNYYSATSAASYSSSPQPRNLFAAPHGAQMQASCEYDPETVAQIAQWQSAYMPRDPNAEPVSKGPNGRAATGAVAPDAAGRQSSDFGTASAAAAGAAAATPANPNEKKKTVVREGGGKKWLDDTLLEWDPAHPRLFVGNLAGETTDDSLLKAFARWTSVQKAKVIRDKRTSKSKGFGFVSFSNPDDFFQAAKEMNGKYIQSHPVVVHKAKTEIKPQVVKEKHHGKGRKNNKKKGEKKKGGNGMGGGAEGINHDPRLGPVAHGGVTKPGQKTRGGLKLLG